MSAWYLEPRGAFSPYVVGESDGCLCRGTESAIAHIFFLLFFFPQESGQCMCFWFQPQLSNRLATMQWHHCRTFGAGWGVASPRYCSSCEVLHTSSREGDREKDRVEVRDSFIFSFPGASWKIWFQVIQNYLSISIQPQLIFQILKL